MNLTSTQKKRALLIALLLIVAVSTALEGLVHDPHHDDPAWTMYWFHHFPGWNGVIGFVGCVLLIWAGKLLGKAWVQKREGYYDE